MKRKNEFHVDINHANPALCLLLPSCFRELHRACSPSFPSTGHFIQLPLWAPESSAGPLCTPSQASLHRPGNLKERNLQSHSICPALTERREAHPWAGGEPGSPRGRGEVPPSSSRVCWSQPMSSAPLWGITALLPVPGHHRPPHPTPVPPPCHLCHTVWPPQGRVCRRPRAPARAGRVKAVLRWGGPCSERGPSKEADLCKLEGAAVAQGKGTPRLPPLAARPPTAGTSKPVLSMAGLALPRSPKDEGPRRGRAEDTGLGEVGSGQPLWSTMGGRFRRAPGQRNVCGSGTGGLPWLPHWGLSTKAGIQKAPWGSGR